MCGRSPRDPQRWGAKGEGLLASNFLSWWVSQTVEAPVRMRLHRQGAEMRADFSVDISGRPATLVDEAVEHLSRTYLFDHGALRERLGYFETMSGKAMVTRLIGTVVDRGEYQVVRLTEPLRLTDGQYGFTLPDPLGRDMARFVESAIGALYLQVVGRFEQEHPKAEDAREGSRGVRSCDNCAFHYRIPTSDEPVYFSGGMAEEITAYQEILSGTRHHYDIRDFFYHWEPLHRLPPRRDFGIPSNTQRWVWPRHVCTLRMIELDQRLAYEANHDRYFPHDTYEPLMNPRARKTRWEDEAISHAEYCPHHHWEVDRGDSVIRERGRVGRMDTSREVLVPYVEHVHAQRSAPHFKAVAVALDEPVVKLPGFLFTLAT